ncbi:MAG: hypothetical protein CL438_02580 [Acidimicrobiaceae bacterium]|jgi:hypothetical protein|nr:hypothetical protein [Acidimicrobiaceae bacterium]HAY52111.1 hypothetical protein [Acidimicrobiaceae bacterium]|tara:strand:+ start:1586 stop:2257 length:672 start_codon:yes stop_codon:yes gene_type:complete
MAFEIETKDCTAVTDAELGELEAVAADSSCDFSMGLLSKQAEEWVLLTTARENDKLRGYVFYTLERIGGTPAVVMGLASVERNNKRATTLRSLMSEVYHRALMAFPDEDVVFGTQFINPGAFEVFRDLEQELPKYGHKVTGEERAWGTRFAKRLGVSSLAYDDRTFVALGDGSTPRIFDYESAKEDKVNKDVHELFKTVQAENGDTLIALAWAMAERLEKLGR